MTAAVKAFACDRGVGDTSTAARIRGLRELGVFDRDSAAELLVAHSLFLRLKLEASSESVVHGKPTASFIYPQEWTEWDKQDLRRAFKAVNHLQGLLRSHFLL